MPTDLTVLAMAKGLASHASLRQSLVTQNIANADTVGFRAQDVKPFFLVYEGPGAPNRGPESGALSQRRATPEPSFQAAATRAGHTGFDAIQQHRSSAQFAAHVYEVSRLGAESPNGNSVSIEDQMARGARAVAEHEMALGVLRKSMDLIRMSIGRR